LCVAPWIAKNALNPKRRVGNGGFSLRHTQVFFCLFILIYFVLFYFFFLQTMLRIAALPRDGFVWEDQYVVSQIPPHLVASEFEAKSFAVDNQYHPDAVALHKPYNLIPKYLIVRALHHIPGTDF
jgi:hypothetical protein